MVSERGEAQTEAVSSLQALRHLGRGNLQYALQNIHGVTKTHQSQSELGNRAKEGESPVGVRQSTPVNHPSNTEHVQFRTNQGRPRSKAKHIQRPIENSTERER